MTDIKASPEHGWHLCQRATELSSACERLTHDGVQSVDTAAILSRQVVSVAGSAYRRHLAARDALVSLAAAGCSMAGGGFPADAGAEGDALQARLAAIRLLMTDIDALVKVAEQSELAGAALLREHDTLVVQIVRQARRFADMVTQPDLPL